MRFYNILLYLYPSSFRAEYGKELFHIFRERRLQAANHVAILWVWLNAFVDIVINAAHAHWDIFQQDLLYTTRVLWRIPVSP
jgi:hypothetical protein